MIPTMKTRHFFLILGACLPAMSSAQLPDEALNCFKWFSTLGYPDVKEARWAELWIGSLSSSGGQDTPKARTIKGFITKESDAEFTLVKSDLTTATIKKPKPETPADERVGFKERPLQEMIEQQLESLRHPPKEAFWRFGSRLGLKAETFFLAYVCWQRGEENQAAQLYQAALLYDKESENLPSGDSKKRKPRPMQEDLEIDLGHAAMWNAVLRCGGRGSSGKSEPRIALLEAFRQVVRLFPHCKHVERANQIAATLERMIKEDEQHLALTQEQIDQLPQDKRIAELVWMLRDQNGYQQRQPGWCDVFSMMFSINKEEKSPAHQLLAIGYPAAPALIEALTDDRFSRSVGFHRSFYFSHTILTIGDCAQQILERLTGQKFHSPDATSANMSNEEKMIAVQKAARKWWESQKASL